MTNIEIQTLEAVKSASRDISKYIACLHNADVIWEQRRYEIAKDMFTRNPRLSPKEAVMFADELIKELKKPTK